MRVWQGKTPDGYSVLVELDARERWVVTIASALRSCNRSLEAALLEAGGASVSPSWAAWVAKAITVAMSERNTVSADPGPA
jgi:hypothetical protein